MSPLDAGEAGPFSETGPQNERCLGRDGQQGNTPSAAHVALRAACDRLEHLVVAHRALQLLGDDHPRALDALADRLDAEAVVARAHARLSRLVRGGAS
jgi:hypothetical protein